MKKDPDHNSTDSAEIEALITRIERGQLRDEDAQSLARLLRLLLRCPCGNVARVRKHMRHAALPLGLASERTHENPQIQWRRKVSGVLSDFRGRSAVPVHVAHLCASARNRGAASEGAQAYEPEGELNSTVCLPDLPILLIG
jgi:hypothetical protein